LGLGLQNYNKRMSFSLFTGKNRLHFNEIDSTNNYALQWVKNKRPPEGSLVTADFQTNGRGQRGNTWVSNREENFIGSFVFYPVFLSAQGQFWLNKALTVGVVDCIKSFLPNKKVQLKWPNDILVEGKKIAGILIENQLQGSQLSSTIFGLGINRNQKEFGDLGQATSLALHRSIEVPMDELIDQLSSALEKRYLQVKAGNYTLIQNAYLEVLFGKGEELKMEMNNIRGLAQVIDVNEFGQIVLSVKGSLLVFSHGEAKILLE
jgi:BirA family biotin operon repressor/biotin-[acetyl-CoA-carboxylase] ligase